MLCDGIWKVKINKLKFARTRTQAQESALFPCVRS